MLHLLYKYNYEYYQNIHFSDFWPEYPLISIMISIKLFHLIYAIYFIRSCNFEDMAEMW